MNGIPKRINTRQDLAHAMDYAKQHPEQAGELVIQLTSLRDNRFAYSLKETAAGKKPEEQTADDFEKVEDLGADLYRFGLTIADVETMIKELT